MPNGSRSFFAAAGKGRVWIVVGYSGKNDPVFDLLAEVDRFEYGLFWAGFKHAEPDPHINEKLLNSDKCAYYVRGFDADGLFIKLGQELNCFPPAFVEKPFTFVRDALDLLTPFTPPGRDEKRDVLDKPKRMIAEAIRRYEEKKRIIDSAIDKYTEDTEDAVSAIPSKILTNGNGHFDDSVELRQTFESMFMAGQYRKIQAAIRQVSDLPDELKELSASAYFNDGAALQAKAQQASGFEAKAMYKKACEKYEAALKIKTDFHEALNNWAIALVQEAQISDEEEADKLLRKAGEKYQQAREIKNDPPVIANWGNMLLLHAGLKSGDEQRALVDKAIELLTESLARNWHGVLYSLACAHSLRGDVEAARKHLSAAKRRGLLPSRAELESDSDLDRVRGEPWFRELLEETGVGTAGESRGDGRREGMRGSS